MRYMCMLIVLLCAGLVSADQNNTNRSYKLLFRDYNVTDQQYRPMSVGLCTWTDSEHVCKIAGYFDVELVSLLEDRLRLGAGVMVRPGDEQVIDMRMITSVSTRIYDGLQIGAYYAPFWGLARNLGDDPPYGVMMGYSIKL